MGPYRKPVVVHVCRQKRLAESIGVKVKRVTIILSFSKLSQSSNFNLLLWHSWPRLSSSAHVLVVGEKGLLLLVLEVGEGDKLSESSIIVDK